jgi:hypothetical protein
MEDNYPRVADRLLGEGPSRSGRAPNNTWKTTNGVPDCVPRESRHAYRLFSQLSQDLKKALRVDTREPTDAIRIRIQKEGLYQSLDENLLARLDHALANASPAPKVTLGEFIPYAVIVTLNMERHSRDEKQLERICKKLRGTLNVSDLMRVGPRTSDRQVPLTKIKETTFEARDRRYIAKDVYSDMSLLESEVSDVIYRRLREVFPRKYGRQ